MSESVAEEKREEPKRTLSRRSHGGPEESGPCYNLLALSEAQWDGDEDVESSLQPVKKRPKKKKQPKDAYMKESDGSLDDDAYSKNPSTVKRTRKPKVERPRWWIQSFLLFLALRQADRPLSRRVLLPRALELDRKIAKQRGLPLLFGGKTPENTASRILTENRDKIFEQVSIPGSDKIHFKLAFEPGNFDEAVELYYEWTRQLIEKDWPFFFGPKREVIEVLPMDKGVIENQPSLLNAVKYDSPAKASACAPEKDVGPQENHHSSKIPIALEEVPKTSPDKLTLEELYDDWDKPIPESLDEVVQVRESTLPGAGRGLFALCDIPNHTYLGFYFGVPMTEDEFDSLKEHVGLASQYSHRYKKTILDATDANGQPYWNHPKIFCPFHFMNEHTYPAWTNVAFVEGYVVNQVLCLTIQDIKAGQELFVNYGADVDRHSWTDSRKSAGSRT